MELTLGDKRVRRDFKPTDATYDVEIVVDGLKEMTAILIDRCEELKQLDPRLASQAQMAYEEACMWAVKAATAGDHA